jgi:putative oxidoreductase
MEIAKHISAYLLAFVFIVFGANFFLHFIPMPAITGDQLTFMTLFGGSGYMTFIKVLEIGIGLLLIFPKTRALGLLLILPIVVNILCFEVFIAKQPGLGVVLLIVNIVGIYFNREKYRVILS